jgi:hypothetical protein
MKLQTLVRDGWTMLCPFCGESIKYTLINNQRVPVPFFYAEDCNDVLLRKIDEKLVERVLAESAVAKPSLDVLEGLWREILNNAPPTRHGGAFGFWSNVKCPSCGIEMPYNNGVKNLELRLYETRIVLLDGALFIRDEESEIWEIQVLIK